MARTRRGPEDSTNSTARGCNEVMAIFSGLLTVFPRFRLFYGLFDGAK